MHRAKWLALVGLLALSLSVMAQPPAPPIIGVARPSTLQARLAAATGESPATVAKILKALGPAVVESIRRGEKVAFPGMGAVQVVQIGASMRRIGDRPTLIPAQNFVELAPTGVLHAAANSPTAVPDRIIPQYNPEPLLPHVSAERVPSGSGKTPRGRTP